MTDIQLPDALLDLFAAFDIADPAQVLIVLLSGILGLLLLLIIIIAARGRSAPHTEASSSAGAAARTASSDEETTAFSASSAPAVDTEQAGGEPDVVEDFKIFKRPKGAPAKPGRNAIPPVGDDQLSTADHLRLIEKNMIRLRDLYQGGHITRDMYVDETRSLYHQARGLSSIS